MSGPVELTAAQKLSDFESANPGKTGVTAYYPVPPINPPLNEENEMADVTIYEADTVVKFGKYKGKDYKIKGLISLDPNYLLWAHNNIDWFALTEQLYYDACVLADVVPSEHAAEKAARYLEQISEHRGEATNGFDEYKAPSHKPSFPLEDDDIPF